ncbi:stalk domain-containing protein [Paenibacillus sp. R14(2021)]|uniref:stalk domain-containing protein n=1 Tax=Paenibacillus sp. R14(2021) TaxID=2859228 RepID=UPI001C614872|nr:NlpC/P60 family protein [Paenibacillus sp. R14(2021)]
MPKTTRILPSIALSLLAVIPFQAATAFADTQTSSPPSVYLDGRPLTFSVPIVIDDGNTLVQMRPIFEAEGAAVTWDSQTRTVQASKPGITFTYRIGDKTAFKNAQAITVPYPGRIVDGVTMVPLRFVSEALDNLVAWHAIPRSITISSSHKLDTQVEYGVNLRTSPDSATNANIVRMLSKDESIHVIREVDADWLEVQTKDDKIGFLSAKPMYTDYTSPALAEKQGDELLAFGSRFLGTPYEFGATSGQTGTFDCSSFVRYVYDQALSIALPRVSYDQAKVGQEVAYDKLRKGDLLFFKARGLDIGHVAIYAGNGQVLHTYSKTLGVHLMKLNDSWKKRFVTARRVF